MKNRRAERHLWTLTVLCVVPAFAAVFSFANWYLTPFADQVLSWHWLSFNSWCDYGWPSPWLTIQRGYDQRIVAVTVSSWFHCFESIIACGAVAAALVAAFASLVGIARRYRFVGIALFVAPFCLVTAAIAFPYLGR